MEVMHHIQCSAQDIGHYVFLPGDPGRVEVIASYLQDAHFVVSNREYTTYTGTLLGVPVSVVSTGIGCPSAAIAMEELTKLGAHTFIRIGTCGCMSPIPTPGDSIIATAAIRRDGTSLQYLPIEFPAVANQQVIQALMLAAREIGIVAHTGIVESKDSYYGQHEPENSPMADELLAKWKMFRQGGADRLRDGVFDSFHSGWSASCQSRQYSSCLPEPDSGGRAGNAYADRTGYP